MVIEHPSIRIVAGTFGNLNHKRGAGIHSPVKQSQGLLSVINSVGNRSEFTVSDAEQIRQEERSYLKRTRNLTESQGRTESAP